ALGRRLEARIERSKTLSAFSTGACRDHVGVGVRVGLGVGLGVAVGIGLGVARASGRAGGTCAG
ncbi:MAG TPA: hypothetical protein VHB97_19705, partial [Polyangia bacterium]|nr:hypothetical protein [Polyangia bacterium]